MFPIVQLQLRSPQAARALLPGAACHVQALCSTTTQTASTSRQLAKSPRVTHALPATARSVAVRASAPSAMATGALEIERVACLSDNYSWILHEPQEGKTAVVDPSEAAPVLAALERKGWRLTHILNTHHHWDHTGGNEELKAKFGCIIVGPAADRERIPGIDVALADGDKYKLGAAELHVFDTPGHTKGHITFWAPQSQALFPGDTLFSLGCGRVFEGTPQMMWASLSKLLSLPHETRVYCAHEYTQSNARFAVSVDPENPELKRRVAEVQELRSKGQPTVPSLLGQELAANPFLRPDDSAIRASLGVPPSASSAEAFGAIRAAKDNFR